MLPCEWPHISNKRHVTTLPITFLCLIGQSLASSAPHSYDMRTCAMTCDHYFAIVAQVFTSCVGIFHLLAHQHRTNINIWISCALSLLFCWIRCWELLSKATFEIILRRGHQSFSLTKEVIVEETCVMFFKTRKRFGRCVWNLHFYVSCCMQPLSEYKYWCI